jgi:hypothetical protein
MSTLTHAQIVAAQEELVTRLRARLQEIEEAILAGVRNVSEPGDEDDVEYQAGLPPTIAAAVGYGLSGIERGSGWAGPIPLEMVEQARRAARCDVALDAVLRRYAAGDRVLGEFVMEEAEDLPREARRDLLRVQSIHLDRVMSEIATEYMREVKRYRRSPAQQTAQRVRQLLEGHSVDLEDIDYGFDATHTGLIGIGTRAEQGMRALTAKLACRALVVRRDDTTVWGWFGAQKPIASSTLERLLLESPLEEAAFAIGEPRGGLAGWRQTHSEAQAAHRVLLRAPETGTVRSADALLLAAVMRDDGLERALVETYLRPLDGARDAGEALRETLRAYFASGRNAAATAAALDVDRHTVQRRLRKAEDLLGRPLETCPELEIALRFEQLKGPTGAARSLSGSKGALLSSRPR